MPLEAQGEEAVAVDNRNGTMPIGAERFRSCICMLPASIAFGGMSHDISWLFVTVLIQPSHANGLGKFVCFIKGALPGEGQAVDGSERIVVDPNSPLDINHRKLSSG